MSVNSGNDLPQVMSSMYQVKPSPLLGGKWSKNGVHQNRCSAPESLLGIRQSRIHCHQSIVETA